MTGDMLGLGPDTLIYYIDPNYVIMVENGTRPKRTLIIRRSLGQLDMTAINIILKRQQLSLKGEAFIRDDGLAAQEVIPWSEKS